MSNKIKKMVMKRKRFLSLNSKIILLTVFLTVSTLLTFFVVYYIDSIRENELKKELLFSNKSVIRNTFESQISQQQILVKDYSVWDDMYQNVQSKNIDWISVNTIPFLISNYGKNYFFILDDKKQPLYSFPPNNELISQDIIDGLNNCCGSFFILKDSIPIHISWSIITTTSDTERKLSPVGYLLIGEEWNSKIIFDMEKKVGLNLYVNPDEKKKNFHSVMDFFDIEDQVIVKLYFESKEFAINTKDLIFFVSLIFLILILSIFWFFLRRYVIKPINIIIKSLKNTDVDILKDANSKNFNDEWDLVVDLLLDNFQKSQSLQQSLGIRNDLLSKLKNTISTRDKLIDLIAHDLKNPFNGIMGFSEIIISEIENLSKSEIKDFLKSIHISAESAYKLLEKLLTWSRLQTDRWTPSPQRFDVQKIIQNVVSYYKANAIKNKVDIILDCQDDYVFADENMIETVIRNLVSNALKFTHNGGSITIKTQRDQNQLLVSIKDTGVGIDSKSKSSLFKVGESIISKDISGNKGTGLGLIMCKDLIEKNGGKIWVESQKEIGSEFYFSIPLHIEYTEQSIK